MICIFERCQNQIWAQTSALTAAAAFEAGWRFQDDGKTPALSIGVALCPDHVKHASEFQPAAAKPKGSK